MLIPHGLCKRTITQAQRYMTKPGIILATTAVILACMAAAPTLRAQAYEPVPVTVSTEKVNVNGKVFLAHTVLERQTLYSIAKAYGVSIDDIYEANPTLQRTGLLKGSIILIPCKEQPASEEVYIPEEGTYKEHLVKWYETIDDIAAMYGLSTDALMEFNHLDSPKLNRRQVLYIPLTEEEMIAAAEAATQTPEDNTPTVLPAETDTVTVREFEIGDDVIVTVEDPIVGKSTVNMALVLPFNAEGRASSMNMDFYAGVLLALRDLQAEGIYTHLSAFDTKSAMPSAYQLSKNDFVLGPVSLQDLTTVLERVGEETTVISPLDQKAIVLRDTFPNFIQAPSYIENQYLELAQWLEEGFKEGETIILMSEKGGSATCTALKEALTQKGLHFEILFYNVSEGSRIPARLASMMQKGRMNHVVVASENESFVADAMRNLSIMNNRGYKVTSYGTSKLRLLDSVDNNYYHQTSLHLTTAYYVDYDDAEVNRFILAFRALYNTEPSQFAFQGYDTAHYFISMIAQYGDKWKNYLDKNKVRMLHLDFLFNKNENGSLSNGAIRRIIYNPDMSMIMVK